MYVYIYIYIYIYIYFFMGVGAVSYCYLKVLEVDSASLNMQLGVTKLVTIVSLGIFT